MDALEDHQLAGLRLRCEVDGPLEVLRSATTVNARLLRREDIGRIGPGAAADLVIFDGNPMEDPSLLWSGRRTVISRGRVVGATAS